MTFDPYPASLLLHWQLEGADIPIDGVNYSASRIDYRPETTPGQRAEGLAMLVAFDTVEVVASSAAIKRLIAGDETTSDFVATVTVSAIGNDWAYRIHGPDGYFTSGLVTDGVLEFAATLPGLYCLEATSVDGSRHGYTKIEVLND